MLMTYAAVEGYSASSRTPKPDAVRLTKFNSGSG